METRDNSQLLDDKYTAGHLGVRQDTSLQTVSFWTTSATGKWPDVWSNDAQTAGYSRQELLRLLYKLSREYKEKAVTWSSSYPLGKQTHSLDLIPEMTAPHNAIVSVVLEIDKDSPLVTCESYKKIMELVKSHSIHLGFIPKHEKSVANRILDRYADMKPGRVLSINPAHQYDSKTATTIKVIYPYGKTEVAEPWLLGQGRSHAVLDEEEQDVSRTKVARIRSVSLED